MEYIVVPAINTLKSTDAVAIREITFTLIKEITKLRKELEKVSIDEFGKMNPQDRAGLHEVMENQTFSLRKIGINMTWEAKTTIFAAAYP